MFQCTGPVVENLSLPRVFCPLIWVLRNCRSFKRLKWIPKTVIRHQHLASILLLSLFKTPQNRKVLKDNLCLPSSFFQKVWLYCLLSSVFFFTFTRQTHIKIILNITYKFRSPFWLFSLNNMIEPTANLLKLFLFSRHRQSPRIIFDHIL